MCEFAVTDINADMGYAAAACIKEYKIAFTQIITGDRSTHLVLGAGLMRQVNADLIKHVHGETGAIKAVSRYSAGNIFGSDGLIDDFIHFGIGKSASCSNG
ncbi:hypothetical protein D3C75_872430 [compost metagenome]